MKILDEVDPLKQMISLNARKTFLLNKRLTLLLADVIMELTS